MNLATIIVTRSKSCHVKTLHSVLRLNMLCIKKNIKNEIVYVNDDPFDKIEIIQKYLKTHDRLFFIDFGIGVDQESVDKVVEVENTHGCLVFPGVKEGIDWELFKSKVSNGSNEPVSQMGLYFDTEIDKKISTDIYSVINTQAKCWVMSSKYILKKIKDKKGKITITTNMFKDLKENGVKIYAFTASKLIMTYTHECVSNILNAAGVKTN